MKTSFKIVVAAAFSNERAFEWGQDGTYKTRREARSSTLPTPRRYSLALCSLQYVQQANSLSLSLSSMCRLARETPLVSRPP